MIYNGIDIMIHKSIALMIHTRKRGEAMMYKLKKKRKKQILNSILLFFCCKKTERIHAVSCDCCIRLMPFLLYSCWLCMYHWCIFNAWWGIASSWFTVLTPAWIIVMLLYGSPNVLLPCLYGSVCCYEKYGGPFRLLVSI